MYIASGDSFNAKFMMVNASSNQRSRKKYPRSSAKKNRTTGKNAKKLLFSGGKQKDRWKKSSAGLPCFIKKLQGDRFAGAAADAGTALDAIGFADNSFAIVKRNCTHRAAVDAGTATGTGFFIDFCSHF